MEDIIVEARNVHRVYEMGATKVHALRGINLQIERGEIVSVMGPSGCGKTTLLNCLSGLDEVTEGEVFIEGVSLFDMNDRQRTLYRAERMGFVFQAYNLLPVLTAKENVQLPMMIIGIGSSVSLQRTMELLSMVDLEDWANHKPAELSAGQQQRVAIARSLANQPAIVWADEPTGNLDSETSDRIMKLIKDLNEENGQTFVTVTHDPAIGEMAGRVLRMKDGRIVNQ